jgi:hypothetical protein
MTYYVHLSVYDMGGEVVEEYQGVPTLGDALQKCSEIIARSIDPSPGAVGEQLDTWSIVDVTDAAGVEFEAQFTFTENHADPELDYSTDYILQITEEN